MFRTLRQSALAVSLFALLSLLAVSIAAADSQTAPPPAPSFKPGATVTLVLEVKAPQKWHLNSAIPLRLQFKQDDIKGLPIKLEKETWDFKVKNDPPSQSFELPIKLTSKAVEGTVTIPCKLMCGICEDDQCTITNEDVKIKVVVKKSAPKDSKNQAQASGKLSQTHKLTAPW